MSEVAYFAGSEIVGWCKCFVAYYTYFKKILLQIFTRESSSRLSHRDSVRPSVRLSVRLSVTQVDPAKTVQARITKSSPSAARKTLVSGTVKLFHKFEMGHPERGP